MKLDGIALYRQLRALTSPIVAITSSASGTRNGMIANSAQRASLVPSLPRVSVYISKTNYTHELIYASGVFGMHLLPAGAWEIVRILGLRSGRDAPKLHVVSDARGAVAEPALQGVLDAWVGETGCPLLTGVPLALECRVVNAMDAGAATFFLGDVLVAHSGAEERGILTSEQLRTEMPEPLRRAYEARLAVTQRELEPLARTVSSRPWPGATTDP
ncbi:MAG: flavin reductase family protein [Longimicrobiales bacterium]